MRTTLHSTLTILPVELLNNLFEYATDNKKILASRLDRAISLRIEYTTRDGRIKEITYIEHYG
ncbi:hypothetical protein HanPSC8_Chr01g0011481 [Helianthus annuus]|nr:hypothetical protein HanPSC8_Chr01g0011481 [Helianthus annuus]